MEGCITILTENSRPRLAQHSTSYEFTHDPPKKSVAKAFSLDQAVRGCSNPMRRPPDRRLAPSHVRSSFLQMGSKPYHPRASGASYFYILNKSISPRASTSTPSLTCPHAGEKHQIMSTKPDQLPNSPVLSEPSRSERSPHPYHRRSGDVPDRIHDCHFSASRSQAIASSTSTVRERQAANYFPPVESKRRKDATSSGDSGTEADDEKPFLRAITAPPLRPRKGLKDLRGAGLDPLASPLLTPTSLDEAGSRSAGPYGSRRRSGPRTITETEDEKARAKRRRRGRAELWRRVAETVSLGLIGYTSVVGSGPDVVQGESPLRDSHRANWMQRSVRTSLSSSAYARPTLSDSCGAGEERANGVATSTYRPLRTRLPSCIPSFYHCSSRSRWPRRRLGYML